MNEIVKILMDRDDMSYDDAVAELEEMRARLDDGEDIEEIFDDYSLEPDYVIDLIMDA